MHTPRFGLSGIVLDSPNAQALAAFYRRLLVPFPDVFDNISAAFHTGFPLSRERRIVFDACHLQVETVLGWQVEKDEPHWVKLVPPDGGAGLSFQTEEAYVRPSWPSTRDDQQMMSHLDIEVDDVEAAGSHAEAVGATLAEFQPQEHVRVYLDPAGHPFCLFRRS